MNNNHEIEKKIKILFDQGIYLENIHDYPNAVSKYLAAIRLAESKYIFYENAYIRLSNVYLLQDRLEESINCLHKACITKKETFINSKGIYQKAWGKFFKKLNDLLENTNNLTNLENYNQVSECLKSIKFFSNNILTFECFEITDKTLIAEKIRLKQIVMEAENNFKRYKKEHPDHYWSDVKKNNLLYEIFKNKKNLENNKNSIVKPHIKKHQFK